MTDFTGRRIFIVADDAGRGEAQFFLLHLMRHLQEQGATIDLFTWEGGGLLDRYREVATVRDLADLNRWLIARVCERLRLRRVGQAAKGMRLRWWLRQTASADAGYLSGAGAARVCGFLPAKAPPLITHLHPKGIGLADLGVDDRTAILDRTDQFVAGSDEIHHDLVVEREVAADRVQRQDYLLLVDALTLSTEEPPTRQALGIPEDAVVVAGAGTADWWAAPDPFVLMAWEVTRRVEGSIPWFLWIAPESGERELWPLHHDIGNSGLTGHFLVLDSSASIDALAVADLLVLVTREDRHVRLAVEAARASMPIVRSQGVGEVLGDARVVVPFLDGDRLADEVADLVASPDLRAEMGQEVASAATAVHDTESGVPEVTAVIGAAIVR